MTINLRPILIYKKITLLQCLRLWWRFAICLIGVLLACSLVTHLLLLAAVSLTRLLGLAISTPSSLTNISHFGQTHNSLLHIVGLSSVAFFIFGQVLVFYLLINYSPAIRKILYRREIDNPYPAPITGQQRLTESKTNASS